MLTKKPSRHAVLAAFCTLLLITATAAHAEDSWPDLSKPAKAIGGGEHDAAVVVGVENYFAVPGVPGAKSNAGEWYDYLTATRGIPPQSVKLLTNSDATREEILAASRKAAGQAGAKGTLWFVFVGHGAPTTDGKDGLLVGVDAQQKAESLQMRSVRRGELLNILAGSPAGSIRVVLDACFSGRGQEGLSIAPGLQPLVTVAAVGVLDPRIAVLTAAKGDQFAGSLPGSDRPAFSYLVLGGLRGWAAGPDGKVTAGSLWTYTKNALAATLRGRDQTPDLLGAEGAAMGTSAGEKGPNLAELTKATAGGKVGRGFQVTDLPSVPVAQAPKGLAEVAAGMDLGSVDVSALERYETAAEFEKGAGAAGEKARTWRELAKAAPAFADMAGKRAAQWEDYAAQKAAADEAREKRVAARNEDWEKLSRLLALKVVSAADKADWSGQFLKAYLKSPGLEQGMAKALSPHATEGALRQSLEKLALSPTIWWVKIPGGTITLRPFSEGAVTMTIKPFQMTKTEVTNRQYKACVAAGACKPAASHDAKFDGDDKPVVNVDWNQAQAFSKWAGGRLPSEAEWEYAGRQRAKEWEAATCADAVIDGCGAVATAPVCSKPAGNTRQGLCDMQGNAWEWVQDWYHDDGPRSYVGAPADGTAWESPWGDRRMIRGGSWNLGHVYAQASYRNYNVPDFHSDSVGFRLAR